MAWRGTYIINELNFKATLHDVIPVFLSYYLDRRTKLAQITAGISEEVANWITSAYKNIVGVGMDVPAMDPGITTGRDALKTLTSHGVYVLDHLKLDQYLPGLYTYTYFAV